MKDVKDLSPADLLAEGRRFVLHVGEYDAGKGFRAEMVFEDHPYRFPTGEVSNLPSAKAPLYFHTDSTTIADQKAKEWCKSNLGIDDEEYLRVICSSIGAQTVAMRVQVKRDPGTSEVWLRDGYGNEMHLEEEHAIRLYQDLATAYYLPFRENCPKCESLLNDHDECDSCQEEEEDAEEEGFDYDAFD
jgi:hypothetical protein